jgi:hypothetical protein
MLRDLARDEMTPSINELAAARAKLDAAIIDERSRSGHFRPSRKLAVAAGMAVVAAAVAGTVLLAGPAPLAAALAEYAAVVLQSEPLEPVEGEFIFQTAELAQLRIVDGSELPGLDVSQLAYVIVEDRKTWVGANETIEILTTPTRAQFFAAEDAAIYEAAGLAELDGIHVTTTIRQQGQAIADLPSDPDQLEEFLREQIRSGGSDLPEDVLLFGQLAALLGDPLSSIETRAASVQVLAAVRGVELAERNETRIVIALEYTDLGHVRRTLELDLATSQLTADTIELIDGLDVLGVPAGATIGQSTYEPLTVTTAGPQTNE